MFEPLKVTYINRDEIIEEFLEKNPEYKGKELTLNVYSNFYNIKYRKKLLHLVQALDGYVFKEAGRVYGYARISRPQQSIDRQIRNIKAEYPSAAFFSTRPPSFPSAHPWCRARWYCQNPASAAGCAERAAVPASGRLVLSQ